MRRKVRKIPADDKDHRLSGARFLANGVLLTERYDIADRSPRNVLHAWTVAPDDLACAPLWGIALPGPPRPLAVHDVEGGFIATSDPDAIHLWDRGTGAARGSLRLQRAHLHAASDGRLWVSVALPDGPTALLVVSTAGVPEMQMSIGALVVEDIVPFRDGSRAAVLLRDNNGYSLHVVECAGTSRHLAAAIAPGNLLAFLPDGSLLAMRSGPVVLDAESGAEAWALPRGGMRTLQGFALAPDGTRLASIHGDPGDHWLDDVEFHIWDLVARTHLREIVLKAQEWPETGMFTPDGGLLLARGGDSLTLWRFDEL